MVKARAVAAVLLCALGTSGLLEARKPQSRVGQVIFADEMPEDLSRTRILKVTIVQELPNEVVVDVEYIRAADFEGDLALLITPDMSHWSVSDAHLQKGKGLVSQSIGIQDEEVKEPVKSNNLAIRIEHYQDRKYKGPIFQRIVPFEKVWTPAR
ncbi:MAG TPA: hypothetical protein VGX68_01160 [Thermoanaerobaculia bacterium]|jgi:hypothetical protein|nr:hypothetical protein [Thermoanaerobaculia bacterium]